jgi:hypothetical protein
VRNNVLLTRLARVPKKRQNRPARVQVRSQCGKQRSQVVAPPVPIPQPGCLNKVVPVALPDQVSQVSLVSLVSKLVTANVRSPDSYLQRLELPLYLHQPALPIATKRKKSATAIRWKRKKLFQKEKRRFCFQVQMP